MVEVVEYQILSHHYPLLLKWESKHNNGGSSKIFCDTNFLKSESQVNGFQISFDENLIEYCHLIHGSLDLEKAFNTFESVFTNVTDRCAPLVEVQTFLWIIPKWFTNYLKNLRSKRYRAHKACTLNFKKIVIVDCKSFVLFRENYKRKSQKELK